MSTTRPSNFPSFLIVKYSDIFLAGGVGYAFYRLLKNKIKNTAEILGEERGKLIVKGKMEKLKKIFGVTEIAEVVEVPRDVGILTDFIAQRFNPPLKIEVHRTDKTFYLTSAELGKLLIENLANKGVKAGWKEGTPVRIDIEKDTFRVYLQRIAGPGGYPVGCCGKVVLLFSGGFDSTLSAWLLARTGLEVALLTFYSSENYLDVVKPIVNKLKEWEAATKWKTYSMAAIAEIIKEHPRQRQLILKRLFYLAAKQYANQIGAKAIATGEALNQANTQRLPILAFLERDLGVPVLRPLLTWRKEEIIQKIRTLGFYELCARVKEICGLSTKVQYAKDYVYEKAEEYLKKITTPQEKAKEIKKFNAVLDLQNPKHLKMAIDEKLEKEKYYALVCPSGETAKMLAALLKKKGYKIEGFSYKEFEEKFGQKSITDSQVS